MAKKEDIKKGLKINIDKSIDQLKEHVQTIDAEGKAGPTERSIGDNHKKKGGKGSEIKILLHEEKFINTLLFIIILLIIFFIIPLILFNYTSQFQKFPIGSHVIDPKKPSIIGQVTNYHTPLYCTVNWGNHNNKIQWTYGLEKASLLSKEQIIDILNKNDSEFIYQEYSEDLEEEINKDQNFGHKNNDECTPTLICTQWSECNVSYDMSNLIEEEILLGTQKKFCQDINGCVDEFVYKKKCSTGIKATIEKTIVGGIEISEIFDESGNKLAKLSLDTRKENPTLDIILY